MKRRSRTGPATRTPAAARSESPFGERAPGLGGGPSKIAILDGDGRIVVVNQVWREAVAAHGFTLRNAGVGAPYLEVVCDLLPDLDRAVLEPSLQRLLACATDDVRHTFAIQTRDGPRWRHVQISPLSVGKAGRFVAIHDDRTELVTTQEAFQLTSQQLLQARDDERRCIAIELHDSTSQHLAAMSLNLARLRRACPADGPAGSIIDEISASLKEAVKETRVVSYLLKPRDLGRGGLSTAVLKFLEGFAARTGLQVALQADGDVDSVPAPLQHAVLRIVQEALLNANRHAQARRVSVELSVDDGQFTMSVADDGCGMQLDEGEPDLGVGIPAMRARAQQFSGELVIASDESGTRVVARLPLP